jgi:hypothetical protein
VSERSRAERVASFFEGLWRDYVEITPSAEQIRLLFATDNPSLANDHVAFRTFDREPIGIQGLERPLLDLGYRRFEAYHFADKKLDAWGYAPADPAEPRIFLSELRTAELGRESRAIIDRLVEQLEPTIVESESVFRSGRPWAMPSWEDYCTLRTESEYAGWLSVFGLRANHFTISVNSLREPADLAGVVARVEQAGHRMNAVGGVLKGSPEALLEQASTLADRIVVRFGDGDPHEIASCYYEFAKRYPGPDGRLFQGFVAASADRIFESTDV